MYTIHELAIHFIVSKNGNSIVESTLRNRNAIFGPDKWCLLLKCVEKTEKKEKTKTN